MLFFFILTGPTAIPRTVKNTIKINGHFYPKGCVILTDIHASHMDPRYWGVDVKEFKPERWINEKGKLIKEPGAFLAFGIGKLVLFFFYSFCKELYTCTQVLM